MDNVRLVAPRALRASKAVRIVLVGGFLGAGKTTALARLSDRLRARGHTVAAITNDQAPNLVDTEVLRGRGISVGEVAGGCFCCRFPDLVDVAQTALDQKPDVLLCEPVGSCTDMSATVLNPLRLFYRDILRFAPFTVVVDPERVRQAVLGEAPDPFPASVSYIFRKQLEEADLIALNKVDTLPAGEAQRLCQALQSRCGKPVLAISAAHGQGMDDWLAQLLGEAPAGTHLLSEIDYDVYAEGEAVLGWLNATAAVKGHPTFAPDNFIRTLTTEIRRSCADRQAEIAHVKASLSSNGRLAQANLTRTDAEPVFAGTVGTASWASASLLLNARVGIAPEKLEQIARGAMQAAAKAVGASCVVDTLQAFRPGYPNPPYRVDTVQ